MATKWEEGDFKPCLFLTVLASEVLGETVMAGGHVDDAFGLIFDRGAYSEAMRRRSRQRSRGHRCLEKSVGSQQFPELIRTSQGPASGCFKPDFLSEHWGPKDTLVSDPLNINSRPPLYDPFGFNNNVSQDSGKCCTQP